VITPKLESEKLIDSRNWKTKYWKSKIGSRKLESKKQKLESWILTNRNLNIWNLKIGNFKAGFDKLKPKNWNLENRNLKAENNIETTYPNCCRFSEFAPLCVATSHNTSFAVFGF